MIAKEFMDLMKKILKVHPEAERAEVYGDKAPVNFVRLDKRHKPARIKLEK